MIQFRVVKRICRPLPWFVIFPDISSLLFPHKIKACINFCFVTVSHFFSEQVTSTSNSRVNIFFSSSLLHYEVGELKSNLINFPSLNWKTYSNLSRSCGSRQNLSWFLFYLAFIFWAGHRTGFTPFNTGEYLFLFKSVALWGWSTKIRPHQLSDPELEDLLQSLQGKGKTIGRILSAQVLCLDRKLWLC